MSPSETLRAAPEPVMVVSSYAEFEAEQVLLALRLAGEITARQEARIGRVLAGFCGVDPPGSPGSRF